MIDVKSLSTDLGVVITRVYVGLDDSLYANVFHENVHHDECLCLKVSYTYT